MHIANRRPLAYAAERDAAYRHQQRMHGIHHDSNPMSGIMRTNPPARSRRLPSQDKSPAPLTMAGLSRYPTATEMLHCIRASVRQIQRETGNARHDTTLEIERRLGWLLGRAMVTRSPFEIAIVLGSGAELMMFPDAPTLEQCAAAVDAAGQRALRSVVWAVRHRCNKAGRGVRRFAIDPLANGGPLPARTQMAIDIGCPPTIRASALASPSGKR